MLAFLAELERKALCRKEIPQHIAIIMDGNGRWAKQRGLPRLAGHSRGSAALKKAIQEAAKLGIKYLSVYAFSTENWQRPKDEVDGLMQLFMQAMHNEIADLKKNKIALKFLGNLSKFSLEMQTSMKKAEQETNFADKRLQLNVMINYGSRAELLQAVNKITAAGKKNVTEEQFSAELYTKGIPDPDLLIRTSGEQRISNYLLWQLSYAEFWFTKKYWPDFDGRVLRQAVRDYQQRQRRKGGI